MEVLRGRALLPAQDEKENAVLGKGGICRSNSFHASEHLEKLW